MRLPGNHETSSCTRARDCLWDYGDQQGRLPRWKTTCTEVIDDLKQIFIIYISLNVALLIICRINHCRQLFSSLLTSLYKKKRATSYEVKIYTKLTTLEITTNRMWYRFTIILRIRRLIPIFLEILLGQKISLKK